MGSNPIRGTIKTKNKKKQMNNSKFKSVKTVSIIIFIIISIVSLTRKSYELSIPESSPQPWRNIEDSVDWQKNNSKVVQPQLLEASYSID